MGGPDSEPSPAPHCGYSEGRGAFLGLETEWEEAPPVSESHQLLSWFPGAQARVLWELPCECLEVGLVWGPDLIRLCCSDPGDLRYRTTSVITPCLASLSGPQLSPLLNGCVRVMVAVLPGAWLQECQLMRDTSPGCMHCPCWLQCPGPLDGGWSAWLRHPALSGTQINETVRIRG